MSESRTWPVHRDRSAALDALRGVAILLVLMYHFGLHHPAVESVSSRALGALCRLGGSGVDLFFVLSGFLITRILLESRSSPRYFLNFFARRFLRIFPLYYGVLVACLIVLPALGVTVDATASARPWWLWLYGTNFYQAWRGTYVFGVCDHFWSLAVEEQFYLVWPFVVFLLSPRRVGYCCVAAIVLAAACRAFVVSITGNPVAAYVLPFCRLDALATGGLLAVVATRGRGLEPLRRWAWPALLGFVMALVGLGLWKRHLATMDATMMVARFSLTSGVYGALLVVALQARPGALGWGFWNSRLLRYLGKYSYGLYVYHQLLSPVFQAAFPIQTIAERSGSALLARLSVLILSTAASVLVALASWILIERPALEWKRAFE